MMGEKNDSNKLKKNTIRHDIYTTQRIIVESLRTPQMNMFQSLQAGFKAQLESIQKTSELLRNTIQEQLQFLSKLSADVLEAHKSDIARYLSEVFNEDKDLRSEIDEIINIVLKSTTDTDELYEDDEDPKWSNLVSAYNKHVGSTERLVIIKDALLAHEEGKYTLSIPILLAQIEGIVTQLLVEWNVIKKANKDSFQLTAAPYTVVNGAKHKFKHLEDNGNELTKRLVIVLRRLFDFRNGILHGELVNYANEDTSKRLYVAIYVLLFSLPHVLPSDINRLSNDETGI